MASHVLFLYYKKKGWYNLVIEKNLEQLQELRKKRKKNIFAAFREKVKWLLKITILI